ncbi:MAG TPA: low molecular weight phosphotyrosine protein phosphatase [Bacteroidales bacterium]|nr:low molecular weight phosphotyrosine protein phosphatase [Bacteroidales bacterium]
MKTIRILFVCLGNICRSPAAEAIFKKIAEKNNLSAMVDSAGTSAWHEGEKADARMRMHAGKQGYNITSVSRKFRPEDFEDFDMIIAMDDNNYFDLKNLAQTPEHESKILRMGDFFDHPAYNYVPDPYYGGDEGFKLVIKLLEKGSKELVNKIKKM